MKAKYILTVDQDVTFEIGGVKGAGEAIVTETLMLPGVEPTTKTASFKFIGEAFVDVAMRAERMVRITHAENEFRRGLYEA